MNATRRRSSIALGIFVIAINGLVETVIADHFKPNPLSPLVWGVLGTTALVSLAAFLRLRGAARREERE